MCIEAKSRNKIVLPTFAEQLNDFNDTVKFNEKVPKIVCTSCWMLTPDLILFVLPSQQLLSRDVSQSACFHRPVWPDGLVGIEFNVPISPPNISIFYYFGIFQKSPWRKIEMDLIVQQKYVELFYFII